MLHRTLVPSLASVAGYHTVLPNYTGRIFQEGIPIKSQEVKTTCCTELQDYLYSLSQATTQSCAFICRENIPRKHDDGWFRGATPPPPTPHHVPTTIRGGEEGGGGQGGVLSCDSAFTLVIRARNVLCVRKKYCCHCFSDLVIQNFAVWVRFRAKLPSRIQSCETNTAVGSLCKYNQCLFTRFFACFG